jgi:uncharacterized protein YycO
MMKKIVLPILLLLLVTLIVLAKDSYSHLIFGKGSLNDVALSSSFSDELKDGDLIFQTSRSSQSKAIQLATNSQYSHCGIVFKEGNSFYVFEAVQPVKRTPLAEWIARGEKGEFVVKRLKNAEQTLTPDVIQKMKEIGKGFYGKNYDSAFEWTDEKIYCSELIWKIYKRATGIEIGNLEQLGDFDLSSKVVKQKIKERYGEKIPLDELVISPASLFESDKLVTIKTN